MKDQTRDEIGLSPGAIHALYTLKSLGAFDGANAEARRVATDALKHPDAAVRKTAVMVLPHDDATTQALLAANALNDPEQLVGLQTLLAFADAPANPAVESELAKALENKTFLNDRWLPDALTALASAQNFRLMRSMLAKSPRKTASSGNTMSNGGMNHEAMHHAHSEVKTDAQKVTAQGDKPDLVITAIRATPANPTVQQTTRMSIEVENRGGVAIPKGTAIPLAITISGPGKMVELVSRTFTDGLAPGEKASISEVTNGPWKGGLAMQSDVVGTFTVAVRADPDGLIPEMTDTNNGFQQKITYQPLANLAGYVLENAARSYAAVAPFDSVVALVASLKTLNDGDAKAVLTGLGRGWDAKAKVTPSAAQGQLLASLSPQLTTENGVLLDGLREVWGLKKGAAADPDVQRVKLKVLPEKLQFDKKEFSVEAGKPVEITLENPDQMQHNLVVCRPKSLETVGAAADKMITMPNGAYKHYVPEIPQVLAATKLVNPDQTETLVFTAPSEPGLYPFVCTFPGHWRVMNGVMRVVKAGAIPAQPAAKK
ncbi:MAG: hypothetical protein H7Y12_00670 [Sphingobacteriaceae bacterium]|nr:hypothetical protein [Cytophagaceae bacterium]